MLPHTKEIQLNIFALLLLEYVFILFLSSALHNKRPDI